MLTRGVDGVAGRVVLDQFDIGGQGGTRVGPFEEIVAEHGVLADAVLERRLHGVDVVEPLAGEAALAEHVLIEVGHGEDVWVHAAVDRTDALEERSLVAGRQRRRHARLQDAIAGNDAPGQRIEHGAVQRVAELADETRHRVAGHARVGVERHDIDDALRQRRVGGHERRVAVAAQQQVELVQLAALAFPAHPAALGFVVEPAPVEQVEARRLCARIDGIKACDAGVRVFEEFEIARALLILAVRPVREQCEMKVAVHVGEEMHLQIAHALLDLVARRDQRWHHDERPCLGRNAVLELVADQARRLEQEHHRRIEDRQHALESRQGEEDEKNDDPPVGYLGRGERTGKRG